MQRVDSAANKVLHEVLYWVDHSGFGIGCMVFVFPLSV